MKITNHKNGHITESQKAFRLHFVVRVLEGGGLCSFRNKNLRAWMVPGHVLYSPKIRFI